MLSWFRRPEPEPEPEPEPISLDYLSDILMTLRGIEQLLTEIRDQPHE